MRLAIALIIVSDDYTINMLSVRVCGDWLEELW